MAPVPLADGRAAAVWSHKEDGGVVRVRVEPFQPLSASTRSDLAAEVERLAPFLGGSPELVPDAAADA